jgi:hypothetical protein
MRGCTGKDPSGNLRKHLLTILTYLPDGGARSHRAALFRCDVRADLSSTSELGYLYGSSQGEISQKPTPDERRKGKKASSRPLVDEN